MLLRLLKYDFRAMWKQFSLIWGAALALALVNRFSIFTDVDGRAIHLRDTFISSVPVFAFTAALIAMFVLSIIFVIQRFSKGLLGDEGYLMHTRPVPGSWSFPSWSAASSYGWSAGWWPFCPPPLCSP